MRMIVTGAQQVRLKRIADFITMPISIKVNSFNEEDVSDFEEGMDHAHFTKQPIIPVIIDSYGGSIYGCNSMISAILNSEIPVATIVTSKAMSAGAVLFGFGTEGYRYVDPNATLMIHDCSHYTEGKVEEVNTDAKHIDQLNKSIYRRLANHVGHQDQDYFLKMIKDHNYIDIFLTSKEAKKHKLANYVKTPKFTTHIDVQYSFK